MCTEHTFRIEYVNLTIRPSVISSLFVYVNPSINLVPSKFWHFFRFFHPISPLQYQSFRSQLLTEFMDWQCTYNTTSMCRFNCSPPPLFPTHLSIYNNLSTRRIKVFCFNTACVKTIKTNLGSDRSGPLRCIFNWNVIGGNVA